MDEGSPAAAHARPKAREEDLIVETLGDEILVYDLKVDEAHYLNASAARVWRHCDGRRSVASLASLVGDDDTSGEEIVRRALDQLGERGLLTDTGPGSKSHAWSRRELLVLAGGAGAAAVSMPVVKSIVAPTPANAQTPSCCNQPCAAAADCCAACPVCHSNNRCR